MQACQCIMLRMNSVKDTWWSFARIFDFVFGTTTHKKGKGVGLKEFLKEMSEEYQTLDKETKTEYNDAAKKLALSEIDMGASPEIEKEIHM